MVSPVATSDPPILIEVFTTTDFRVRIDTPSALVEIYVIDRIAQVEAALSDGLPVNPEGARRMAQARLAPVLEKQVPAVRHAALGLSKAMQYGIDRYPAIVFEQRAAVYGVTDLDDALDRYRRWQETSER